jgi:hypothetical protein
MSNRNRFLFNFLCAAFVAHPVQAEELPVIGQSAVRTPSRAEQERDLGLEMLWLPVESRSSLTDYVGRNLPGATLSPDGDLLLRGGRAQDTAFELDGLRVRRLFLPPGMVERFDLATASYGAEWSDVMGGVLAASTKAGDDRLRADAEAFSQKRDTVTTRAVGATVSAPILRDRLLVLVSARAESATDPSSGDPEGIFLSPPDRTAQRLDGGLKLTWVPSPSQRLESLTLLNSERRDNVPDLGIDRDAEPTFGETQWMTSLRWSGRLGERVTAGAQLGFQSWRTEEAPLSCRTNAATCDTTPPQVQKFPLRVTSGNWLRHQIERDTEWQPSARVEALLHEGPRLRERLRLLSRLRLMRLAWRTRVPGDQLTELNQGPESQTITFANDPRFAPAEQGWFSASNSWWTTVEALESESRLFDRLWIIPGLGLTTSGARTAHFTTRATALTPHLALAWDAQGDGRTWLHASVQQRAGGDLEDLTRLARPSAVSRRCNFDPNTGAFSKSCVWSGGDSPNTVGQPCGVGNVGPDGRPCDAGLRLPRSWELAVGASQELGRGVRAGADVIYRRPHDLPAELETNEIWNPSADAVTGYRSGRAEKIVDYSPSAAIEERYLGATAWLRREAGALRFLLSYTLSRHEGVGYWSAMMADAPSVSRSGLAPDDRPQVIRAIASYDLHGYASLALAYSHESGRPAGFYIPIELLPRGVNPGPKVNVNDPGDQEPDRTPSEQRLNLQLRVRAQRLVGVDLDLYLDLLDVLVDRHVVVSDNAFNAVTIDPGRWARVGLELRY